MVESLSEGLFESGDAWNRIVREIRNSSGKRSETTGQKFTGISNQSPKQPETEVQRPAVVKKRKRSPKLTGNLQINGGIWEVKGKDPFIPKPFMNKLD